MNLDAKQLLARYQPKPVKVLTPDRQLAIVRFSPCGKVLAAGDHEGKVRRWDASTDAFAALPPLTGHGGWVQALAFHPDGKRLFAADSWGRLRCWPFADKTPRPLWDLPQAHAAWVRQVAVSPDGQALATCGADRVVRLWSSEGKKLREFPHDLDVFAVAFHPDGKALVTGDLKGAVRHWDLATGKVTRSLNARVLYHYERIQDVGGVRRLEFDAAGTTLACAGSRPITGGFVQGTPLLLLFDWQTGKMKQEVAVGATSDGFLLDLAWHRDGFVMAVTSGQPGTGKMLFHRPGDAQPFFLTPKMANCHALAVHPGGTRLVVAATNANSSGNGRIKGKSQEYPGNFSPLHVWDLPRT